MTGRREYADYLDDMLDAVNKAIRFAEGMDYYNS